MTLSYADGLKTTSRPVAAMVLELCGPTVTDLLCWLISRCEGREKVNIHQWYGSRWYFEVKKPVGRPYPKNVRIGFTVDLKADKILWNDERGRTSFGGNCFLRDRRWKRLLQAKFPEVRSDKDLSAPAIQYHDYCDGVG